jgi:hypothetical protein
MTNERTEHPSEKVFRARVVELGWTMSGVQESLTGDLSLHIYDNNGTRNSMISDKGEDALWENASGALERLVERLASYEPADTEEGRP